MSTRFTLADIVAKAKAGYVLIPGATVSKMETTALPRQSTVKSLRSKGVVNLSTPLRKPQSSALEERFLALWRECGGPALMREVRFYPGRKWRFDFALVRPSLWLAVEIEGGCWSKGRHTRGSGFVKDAEKYLAAFSLGWAVVRLPAPLITRVNLLRIIQRINSPDPTK